VGIYEEEDIKGYFVGEKVVCPECLTDNEEVEAKEEDLILQEKLEEKAYFCDRCKKKL